MTKRIALFLDGTWNTVQDNTNVWTAAWFVDTYFRPTRPVAQSR